MSSLRVLLLHGLGDHRESSENSKWATEWQTAIREVFPKDHQVDLDFSDFTYDPIFEEVDISAVEATVAVGKLIGSGISTGVEQIFRRKRRGLFDGFRDGLKWSAGYVVAWVEDAGFQKQSRELVYKAIKEHKPDVLVAHSLGTLVTYNALLHEEAGKDERLGKILSKLTYVTLGSQIGNPFVRKNLTGGRLVVPAVRQWFHLYNVHDDVFTAPISISDSDNFLQVETSFDLPGWSPSEIFDHNADGYLKHINTIRQVWGPLGKQAAAPARTRVALTPPKQDRKPRRRGLLVGINDYVKPELRLDGCVNDVFLFSSVLQDLKFEPEQLRVVLNDRATAAGIIERMEWLVDDARPGDELVFYFSGHGAQLPAYNPDEIVDHMDETLVPHDFDWSLERCITDDQIYDFYAQLPYDTRLFMIFDCCHSGGINRGNPRVRGLNPPDDIRHRALKWNSKLQMWEDRQLKTKGEDFIPKEMETKKVESATMRLGRGSLLRQKSATDEAIESLVATKSSNQKMDPYLPTILQACGESQFAFEYRHGATSYGAFTYSLAKIFREKPTSSLLELQDEVRKRLDNLGYEQKPQFIGPSAVLNKPVIVEAPKRTTKRRKRK